MSLLRPTGCNCLCHDADGDTNIEGGCELCSDVHAEDEEETEHE